MRLFVMEMPTTKCIGCGYYRVKRFLFFEFVIKKNTTTKAMTSFLLVRRGGIRILS